MTWILIVMLWHSPKAPVFHEFSNKERCEVAAAGIRAAYTSNSVVVCAEK